MQFASMFHEYLRQRSQRVEVGEGVVGALARQASNAVGGSQGSSQPLRLSDMLKRVSSPQKAGRKMGVRGGGGLGLCKRLLSR